jgi:hypothetical protein
MQLATVIVLALVTLGQAAEKNTETVSKLERFCRGDKNVKLRTLTELKQLSVELESLGTETKCSSSTQSALKELAEIAEDRKPCTQTKADAIVKFTNDYLKKPAEELPKALYKFAVAYGMQVSRICKQLMYDAQFRIMDNEMKENVYKVQEQLKGSNRNRIIEKLEKAIGKGTAAGRLLDSILKTGDFILPSDLFDVLPELKSAQTYTDEFRSNCDEYVRPAYKAILMPIATLDRAGYNFKAFPFKLDSMMLARPKNMFFVWAKRLFACEAASSTPIDEIEPISRRAYWEDADIASKAKIGNTVVPEYDFRLKKAVESFDPDLTPSQRIQGRILASGHKILRKKFKNDEEYKQYVDKLTEQIACSRDVCQSSEDIKKANHDIINAVMSDDDGSKAGSLVRYLPSAVGNIILDFFCILLEPRLAIIDLEKDFSRLKQVILEKKP